MCNLLGPDATFMKIIFDKLKKYVDGLIGYKPTPKELKNKDVKELAARLKGKSYKETLTNILEWQERNLKFWQERYYLQIPFFILLASFLFLVVVAYPLYVYLPYLSTATRAADLGFIVWFAELVAAGAATAFTIILIQLISVYKIPLEELLEAILDTAFAMPFRSSLPVKIILKRRLAVCRDYAKLTVCLLLASYPGADIYFVKTPNHVAAGIKIKSKVYILDQFLPVVTIRKWNTFNHINKVEKFKNNKLIRVKKVDILPNGNKRSDTKSLIQQLSKLINTKNPKMKVDKYPSTWKDGAIAYENDEIINYSLERAIKNKISRESYDGLIQVKLVGKDIKLFYYKRKPKSQKT